MLEADLSRVLRGNPVTTGPGLPGVLPEVFTEPTVITPSGHTAIAAYQKQEAHSVGPPEMSGIEKYKDDQLLMNPGGDHYYLEEKRVIANAPDQESFWGRIGKDLSDAFANVKNFFHDLLFGAKIHYRDENGEIRETTRRGVVGSVIDFFKDLGSALSFGAWRPDGEKEPQGFLQRVGFFFSKMKEAIFGDILQGIAGSIVHLAKDLLFAGWNLLETIPDATIGNFEGGKRLTTAIFDTGQVVLDYLTDIIPFGDAWVRVHSLSLKDLKPPILFNLDKPEHDTEDDRWRYVRNTPFRKTIETLGSLLMDVLTLKVLGHAGSSSEKRHTGP